MHSILAHLNSSPPQTLPSRPTFSTFAFFGCDKNLVFHRPKRCNTIVCDTMSNLCIKEEGEEDIFYSPNGTEEEEDEDEKKKILLMRAVNRNKDPTLNDEVDDSTMRRFLRARDLNVEKASTMLMNYLKWRRGFVPNGFISESQVGNHIAHKKAFTQGYDKQGAPIGVVFGARHLPSSSSSKGDLDEFKMYVVFVLDKMCSRISGGEERFIVIIDLEGYKYANADTKGYISILSILQNYYPERLKRCFIIHAHYIFMAIWKVIYPFIDRNTREKIVFVEKKRIRESLSEEIDEDELPEIYGGKLKLVPIEEA